MGINKTDLDLHVKGHTARAYAAVPDGGGPGVLVLHAWWGLKPFFKQVCDRLAAEGFTALAPDLLMGHTAGTIAEAEALLHLEQDNVGLLTDIVQAGLGHLSSLSTGNLGVMGFSMGAYWSMVAAANHPGVKAVVLYYGTSDVDPNKIRASVQGHFAEHDPYESPEGVRAMREAMKASGVDATFYTYAGTSHWFMEDDRPEYDPGAAVLAWERTIAFLKKTLG